MLENNFIIALLLTLFAGLATGVGGAIIMFVKKFNTRFLALSLGFSAGVMILVSFVELFTEARTSLSENFGEKLGLLYTFLAFFGGMGLIAIIDILVPSRENPHEINSMTVKIHQQANNKNITQEETNKQNAKLIRLGIMSSIVIAIHNFPEGMATFISAMDNIELGISIAFAIALHNIPEGIAIAIPIYYATKKRKKAVLNATLSGIAEPLGGVLGYFLLMQFFSNSLLGIILATIAGIMVYISLDELLPTAENYGEHHAAIIGVVSGMAFMGLGLLLF